MMKQSKAKDFVESLNYSSVLTFVLLPCPGVCSSFSNIKFRHSMCKAIHEDMKCIKFSEVDIAFKYFNKDLSRHVPRFMAVSEVDIKTPFH